MAMTSRERKIELLRRGKTQADIARRLAVSESYVSQIIKGTRRNRLIERAIARAIGKPIREVFTTEAA